MFLSEIWDKVPSQISAWTFDAGVWVRSFTFKSRKYSGFGILNPYVKSKTSSSISRKLCKIPDREEFSFETTEISAVCKTPLLKFEQMFMQFWWQSFGLQPRASSTVCEIRLNENFSFPQITDWWYFGCAEFEEMKASPTFVVGNTNERNLRI